MKKSFLFSAFLLLCTAASAQLPQSFPKSVKMHEADSVQVKEEMGKYMQQLGRLEARCHTLDSLQGYKMFETNANADSMHYYADLKREGDLELRKAQAEFLHQNPKMHISGDLSLTLMRQPWEHTAAEIDAYYKDGSKCSDKVRKDLVERTYQMARKYVIGADCPDIIGADSLGKDVKLSSLLTKDGYTLLDFWASWCGPCRSAIPVVRALEQKYAGSLHVISISLDTDSKKWHSAMDAECMPWPQVWLNDTTRMKDAANAFCIQGIPHLVLIDRYNKVCLVTYDARTVRDYISERLQPTDFTLECVVPGLKQGLLVNFEPLERPSDAPKFESKVTEDGRITFTGHVPMPTLYQLTFNAERQTDKGPQWDPRSVEFMLENRSMRIEAACFDSLPSRMPMLIDLQRRAAVKVIGGGLSEREYLEYQKYMTPSKAKSIQAWADWAAQFEKKDAIDDNNELKLAMDHANAKVDETKVAYRNSHPTTIMSSILLAEKLREPFAFSSIQLDSLERVAKKIWDEPRKQQINSLITEARTKVRQQKYTDFPLCTVKGSSEVKNLSDYKHAGKYLFIDMWASWCGPCRAAIPKVKKLYAQANKKVDFISISCDSDEQAWRDAMAKEGMKWTQLWLNNDQKPKVRDDYKLKSIPYLIIIDPEGYILYAGNSVEEAAKILGVAL